MLLKTKSIIQQNDIIVSKLTNLQHQIDQMKLTEITVISNKNLVYNTKDPNNIDIKSKRVDGNRYKTILIDEKRESFSVKDCFDLALCFSKGDMLVPNS